jgi:hypothetical protein
MRGVEVIVRGAERQEPAFLALFQHDAGEDAKRRRRGGDRAVVLETNRYVEADGLAQGSAIEPTMIETMVRGSIAEGSRCR